jgi:DNA-directed RNA polymerase subunit RPC12/RpoP
MENKETDYSESPIRCPYCNRVILLRIRTITVKGAEKVE